MRALVIAANAVRRLLRDRSSLFFVFVFPLLLVLLLGSAFGGDFASRLGVVGPDGRFSGALRSSLADLEEVEVDRYTTVDDLRDDVARGRVDAGLVLPSDYDDALQAGRTVRVGFLAGPDATSQLLRAPVTTVIGQQANVVRAARFAAARASLTPEDALRAATAASAFVPGVQVTVTEAGDSTLAEFEGLGQFDLAAHQELLLFTFLTSLTAAAALIEARQLGVTRRMLSTPTSTRAILVGEALGRFFVAMVQGLYIVLGTLLLYGVDWGAPAGWVALLTLFASIASGAGMLMGATFRNIAQANGLGIFFALALAALGGCMLPLELFSPTVRTVAHVTPHAWALDGFAQLVRHDGSVTDIGRELAVLAAYAVALLGVASWRLRGALTR